MLLVELYIAESFKPKYLCGVQKNKTMKTKTFTSKILKTILLMIAAFLNSDLATAQNWTQINSGTQKKINTIYFTSSTIGYLGGNDSLLMKTTDGGATWSQLNFSGVNFLTGGEHILNLQFLTDNIGFMTVGPYSGSYGTTDGGLTWSLIDLPGNHCYNQGLFFFDENNGFIGGSGCFQGELISAVSNANWQTGPWTASLVNSPSFNPSNIITDIDFYNSSFGLAVSKSGYVFRTTDGGLNWDSIATPAPLIELTSVLIVNDTLAYAGYNASNTGFGLYISTDAGLTWSYDGNSATFFYPNFFTLHKTSNGSIYTGGNSQSGPGVIFYNLGGFSFWNIDAVDQQINDVASYNDSVVFAVGDSGYIVVNHPQAITSIAKTKPASHDFSIFPNPVSNELNISASDLTQPATVEVKIYSSQGQLVKTHNMTNSIDVSELTQGIYIVEIASRSQSIRKKFVKE